MKDQIRKLSSKLSLDTLSTLPLEAFGGPIRGLGRLPSYAVLFLARELGPFRPVFILLSLCSAASTLLRFTIVYLLSSIISHIPELTLGQIFGVYIPLWLIATIGAELLDFFTRRDSETFPQIYSETLALRFYASFASLSSYQLLNISKDRLAALVGRYCSNVQAFLNDWFWTIIPRTVRLVVISVILWHEGPVALAGAMLFLFAFLASSLRVSRRFSPIAREAVKQSVESNSTIRGYLHHLSSIRRLGLKDFYLSSCMELSRSSWAWLRRAKHFHAWRWFFQLNAFNLIYIGTLSYAVWRVKEGFLPIGFLVLIKWSFDELWQIVVWIIEYYVSLVQQREDAVLIRSELGVLESDVDRQARFSLPQGWHRLLLEQASISFRREDDLTIKIPVLVIPRGSRIAIVGENGSGKSTTLHMLANVIPFEGSYRCDDTEISRCELVAADVMLVSPSDPLFPLSIRDNLLVGTSADEVELRRILRGVGADSFTADLDARVGTPDFHLSTGQEQRLKLARALLRHASVYLLDEPFTGIDIDSKFAIIDFLLRELAEKTVVLVSHHEEELEHFRPEGTYKMESGVLSPRLSQ